jgi:hypothetical protein
MRKIGFSGTRNGMTGDQSFAVAGLLRSHDRCELHHGDCIGADFEAGIMARAAGHRVSIHPPTDPSNRAFSLYDVMRPVKPYLVRNRNIVDETDELIATPAEMTEQQRGGTWSTIRYARRKGKPITVILPDGTIQR